MPADLKPTIIIDTREQTPLSFTGLPSIRGTLQSGDYSLLGCEDSFAVERKTIADFVGCCIGDNRERFERELHRLRGFQFKRLLIIGSAAEVERHRYVSKIPPASVLGSLAAWEVRYDVPVIWMATAEAAALAIERWAGIFSLEILKRYARIYRPAPPAQPITA
jgi:ERCC4-type nuclease